MVRFVALLPLLISGAAIAQTAGGQTIAYMKVEGSGAAIYVTDDLGSTHVKIYATPAKRTIGHLDLKPGGGEIAFTEFGKGTPRIVRLLSFNATGPIGNAWTLTGIPCGVDTVDYHPTAPALLISEACGGTFNISSINTDGSGRQPLVTSSNYLNKGRWLKDGVSFVYVRGVPNVGLQLCRNGCDPSNSDVLWTGGQLMWMDVARQSNSILFDSGGIYTNRLDADTGSLQTNFIVGTDGHFSPSDEDVLYETPHEARGDYLMIRRGNGSTFRLTTKGDYGSRDWRN